MSEHLTARARRNLRLAEVQQLVPAKKSTIYGWIKAGKFPSPIKLGWISAWPEEAIDAWIAENNPGRAA